MVGLSISPGAGRRTRPAGNRRSRGCSPGFFSILRTLRDNVFMLHHPIPPSHLIGCTYRTDGCTMAFRRLSRPTRDVTSVSTALPRENVSERLPAPAAIPVL